MINNKEFYVNKAQSLFDEGYACSQAVLLAFADDFDVDAKTAKLISSTFGGGMGRLRQKCGAVTGGFMVLGLKYGNEIPTDMETKLDVYKKVRDLNRRIENIHGTSNCNELLVKYATEKDVENRSHHKLICKRVVGEVVAELYDMLQNVNEDHTM